MPTAASPVTRRLIVLGAVLLLVVVIGYEINRLRAKPHGEDASNDLPQLRAVKTYDYPGGDHTHDPVTYPQTPPAGGPHNPAWEDCGVYTQPIANENALHALEHGTVWITYDPSLSAADVQTLETALGTVTSRKTILSPYTGLPAPVVVTVWDAQLALKSAHDPRLPVFLTFYGDGHTSPEGAFASCAGGVHTLATAAGS